MKKSLKTILLSLLVMALWGSLFPMVKLGYSAFDISAKSVPDILMFASYRFIISGLVVSLFCFLKKEKIATPKAKSILNIVIMGLFSIVLHYACTYIGLSTTDSSKTALIKQLGALIYVCFAFLFFKNEKFSILKIIGAIVGFGGIIAINYNPDGLSFAVGDILIIGASICTVVANVISKKSVQGSSPYWITGISQLFGGIVLFIA
ncbi:MAG: DMT family transporter, partial [Clostridia bacterium]|nr:DMT family transporter [Clostridia bacterium]